MLRKNGTLLHRKLTKFHNLLWQDAQTGMFIFYAVLITAYTLALLQTSTEDCINITTATKKAQNIHVYADLSPLLIKRALKTEKPPANANTN